MILSNNYLYITNKSIIYNINMHGNSYKLEILES